jgi:hypothetical protein
MLAVLKSEDEEVGNSSVSGNQLVTNSNPATTITPHYLIKISTTNTLLLLKHQLQQVGDSNYCYCSKLSGERAERGKKKERIGFLVRAEALFTTESY